MILSQRKHFRGPCRILKPEFQMDASAGSKRTREKESTCPSPWAVGRVFGLLKCRSERLKDSRLPRHAGCRSVARIIRAIGGLWLLQHHRFAWRAATTWMPAHLRLPWTGLARCRGHRGSCVTSTKGSGALLDQLGGSSRAALADCRVVIRSPWRSTTASAWVRAVDSLLQPRFERGAHCCILLCTVSFCSRSAFLLLLRDRGALVHDCLLLRSDLFQIRFDSVGLLKNDLLGLVEGFAKRHFLSHGCLRSSLLLMLAVNHGQLPVAYVLPHLKYVGRV